MLLVRMLYKLMLTRTITIRFSLCRVQGITRAPAGLEDGDVGNDEISWGSYEITCPVIAVFWNMEMGREESHLKQVLSKVIEKAWVVSPSSYCENFDTFLLIAECIYMMALLSPNSASCQSAFGWVGGLRPPIVSICYPSDVTALFLCSFGM